MDIYSRIGEKKNKWKEVIILMGGDIHGNWEIDFSHSMACYVLTMKNHGKVLKVSNKGFDWMFPQFKDTKETGIDSNIIKCLKAVFGRWMYSKGVIRQENQFIMDIKMIWL